MHNNKNYYWVLHNPTDELLHTAEVYAQIINKKNIASIKVCPINTAIQGALGGDFGIAEIIEKSREQYWMKLDQDIFLITDGMLDDLFSKCQLLHRARKNNFGCLSPFVPLNLAMGQLLIEKLNWPELEYFNEHKEEFNAGGFFKLPWWQTEWQQTVWERTDDLLKQANQIKGAGIVQPTLSNARLSISSMVFPKISFRNIQQYVGTPYFVGYEQQWWNVYGTARIFIDTDKYAVHYPNGNARATINELYRGKIFGMVDKVVRTRLPHHGIFRSVIEEVNKTIPEPIIIAGKSSE
jgi:hypothetical protein